MKKVKWMMSVLAVAAVLATTMVGCNDDEPPALALVSLTANGIDLNAATSATGIPVGANIVATFNVAVDAATANSAISLVRQFDSQNFPAAISVNGAEVTINPNTDFSTGTLFILTFGAGLKSAEGKTLTAAIERNFTSEGTFAVPGAVAHWTFEDNAVDIIGNRAPTATGTVAITYVAGRKADAGKAASFNGTTSIIEYANGDQLMNNGSWTMSLWVKPNSSLEKGQFVLGLGAFYGFQFEIFGSYNGFKLAASYAHTNPAGAGKFGEDLWADGEGNLGWQGWVFSKDFRPAGMNTVIKDQWAHYVFVYNATTRQGIIYLNGERIKEQDFDLWPDGTNPRFATGLSYRGEAPDVVNELALGFIHSRAGTMWDAEPWGGYDFPGANHFHGLMDDLIIYHKALTQAEITAMYNSGKP
ncbi:MAG: Ig-like domain-containing protein [Cyclobacteriaceae bacterium]|nr:Ig-like domain-containing protein [Cyclobacteriaceae bacterium]UYN86043.1 MAG: Ig-like domain-containing protein [Cyclobacteriaceae bacterium]